MDAIFDRHRLCAVSLATHFKCTGSQPESASVLRRFVWYRGEE